MTAHSVTGSSLAHRWTFNGTLADSVGGVTATVIDPDANSGAGGTSTLSSTNLLLGGGARSTSAYVQLGSGLLSGRPGAVTIELWVTHISAQNWSRMVDVGSGTTDNLFLSWTQGTNLASDRITWADTVTNTVDNSCAPYTLGTKYHVVMTIEPTKGSGGTTRVTWYSASATSPVLGSAQGTFDTTNTLPGLADTAFWLGRSQFTADNTANARYDEVRIWDGALTSAEREDFHQFGPDYPSYTDSDGDGLPDGWEMARFGHLNQIAGDNSDGDAFTNAQEYAGGSNPTVLASIPGDVDGDTLGDAWELTAFGNLDQAASTDNDSDGQTNATEFANGSSPVNRASTATDIDADSLPDAWETQNLGTLTGNGGSDPDADGFSNLQEQLAGTNPALATSRPTGTAVKLVPLDDGNSGTSEFGYAGSSAINSVAFVRSSLKTVGNQQFITWYGRHQYDSNAAYNNTIWIGRRTLGSSQWEVFRHPTFTANAITDGHDVISYGIDGDGYMHVSWGMHGDAFHYSRSFAPVTGTEPIVLGPDTVMTGREDTVTYPQFLKLPDGDLLFIFREVASGNGDTFISRYDTATKTWDNVHRSGTTQLPFIKGTGWTPNYNAYLNMPQLGGDGDDLILTWCWRYEPVGGDSPGGFDGYQTNNHLSYARSLDAGLTWQRFDGTAYSLPISRDGESGVAATTAERIVSIPEGSSLINQASTCLDKAGNPVTATWWAPNTSSSNYRRQYMVVFRHDNGTWQQRPVSTRAVDPTGTRYAENHVRDLGRPIVVNDEDDRIIVAYRDNQASNLSNVDNSLNTGVSNGLTIVHSLPKAQDPDRLIWIEFNLTSENLGNYEPIIDNELWDRERQLHFLYQPSGGQGYTPPANTASRMSVLEWDAKRYFRQDPQPSVAFNEDHSQVTLTCPTEPSYGYKLFSSTNLQDWQLVQSYQGNGEPLVITQAMVSGEPQKFWKIQFLEGGY